jgi:hypothetical protein
MPTASPSTALDSESGYETASSARLISFQRKIKSHVGTFGEIYQPRWHAVVLHNGKPCQLRIGRYILAIIKMELRTETIE